MAKRNHLKTPATSAPGRNKAEEVLRRMKQLAERRHRPKSSNGKVRERSINGPRLIRNDLRREAQARATLRRMSLDVAEKRAELVRMKEALAEAETVAEEMAEEVAGMREQKKQAAALLHCLMMNYYGL